MQRSMVGLETRTMGDDGESRNCQVVRRQTAVHTVRHRERERERERGGNSSSIAWHAVVVVVVVVLRLTHALAQEAASGESVRGEQRSGAGQRQKRLRESRLGVSDYLRTATYVGTEACY